MRLQALEGRVVVDGPQKGDGTGLAWTTGIAEVSLPIDFKLRNIEATEAARKKQTAEKEARRELNRISQMQKTLCLGNTTNSLIRQQQQEKWKSEHKGSSNSSDAPHSHHPGASLLKTTTAPIPRTAPAGFQKSTDDITVGKFIKRQSHIRR